MLREFFLLFAYFNKKKLLTETEFLNNEELQRIQSAFLLEILIHAASHVPFYKSEMGSFMINEREDPVESINQFPIIDKRTVRNNLDDFICGRKLRRLKATTGGSTGQPFVFYMDRLKTRQIEKAFIFDLWSRVGYKMGDKIFNLRGRTPKKGKFIQHDFLFNIYYASSFDLKSETIELYVKEINKIRPKYLHGYPSTMFQLANLLNLANKRLEFCPVAVFCGSEKLFPFQRALIEKVFQCRVYSWYGHSECLALGGECEFSHDLHFYPQYGYTELIPTQTKNSAGKEIYSIVATGFNNNIMPMIRYQTGDYAVLADNQQCACGRNYLLIEEVLGREQEFIVDSCGDLISATSLIFGQHFDVFSGIDGLFLKQRKPGFFSIYMKKNNFFLPDPLDEMKSKIKSLLGDRFKVDYEFTEKLPISTIGKAKIVQQELDINQYFKNLDRNKCSS